MTATAQTVEDIRQDLRSPLFGGPAFAPEPLRTATIPDAVRRARWIAVDMNAQTFGLFFTQPTSDRTMLWPCFDSSYPAVSSDTVLVAGENRSGLLSHIRSSSLPLWWADGVAADRSSVFETLDWPSRTEALVPDTAGIAFPVHTEQRSGMVVFLGADITLTPESLFDSHARCFSLFEAVARMRPGEGAQYPAISKRELECLRLTAKGCTSEEIARRLKLSVHTANQYLTNTVQKLDAVNRMHAVAKALRLGLID